MARINKKKRFLFNSLLMSVTSVLVSGIGVWFSLAVSSAIGEEAMGVFQLILSVVSFGSTFACSGIQLAAARLTAKKLGEKKEGALGSVMRRCFVYGGSFGTAGCILLFCLSQPIAVYCLHNPVTALPMQVAAFSLPLVGLTAALNGYFTAVGRVGKCCFIQVAEQLCRVGLTLLSLQIWGKDLSSVCCCILGAGLVSQLLGFLLLFLLYCADRRRYTSGHGEKGDTAALLRIGLPIAGSTYLRSGLLTVKNLLAPAGLVAYGLSRSEAVSIFGGIHGVVLPLVLFFGVLLTAASDLLMPELAKAMAAAQNPTRNKQVLRLVERMFKLSLLFSFGVAAGLFSLAEPLSRLVDSEIDLYFYLMLFAPLVPVMYFDTAVDSMLKGLDQQLYSMGYNILDAGISLILVLFLVPHTGVAGYLFVIFQSEVLNAALSLNRLLKVTGVRFRPWTLLVKPILAAIGGGALSFFCQSSLSTLLPDWLTLGISVGVLLLGYYLLCRLLGCITAKDQKLFRQALQG